jgi:hypothetical protein
VFRQFLRDDAADDVGAAARGKPDQHAYGFGRIRLRDCDGCRAGTNCGNTAAMIAIFFMSDSLRFSNITFCERPAFFATCNALL